METVTYKTILHTVATDGVKLLEITLQYPIFCGTDAVIVHMNEFEATYADTLAKGIVQKKQPALAAAWQAHKAAGGRKSDFSPVRCTLTGTAMQTDGEYLWVWEYRELGGGEHRAISGVRRRDKHGNLRKNLSKTHLLPAKS